MDIDLKMTCAVYPRTLQQFPRYLITVLPAQINAERADNSRDNQSQQIVIQSDPVDQDKLCDHRYLGRYHHRKQQHHEQETFAAEFKSGKQVAEDRARKEDDHCIRYRYDQRIAQPVKERRIRKHLAVAVDGRLLRQQVRCVHQSLFCGFE